MSLITERLIRFDLTCDDTAIVGVKSINLPSISEKTVDVDGSGIMGTYQTPVLGQLDNMEVSMDLTHVDPAQAVILQAPIVHNVIAYIAAQVRDNETDEISVQKWRITMRLRPKSVNEGSLQTDNDLNGTTTFACSQYKMYINGELTCDVEPLNSIYLWNGTDYYADVRTALDL